MKNKRWKKILTIIAVLVLAVGGYGYYLYNKKPADVRKQSSKFEVTATALVTEFSTDENAANRKYLDRVISVKGRVSEVSTDTTGKATVFLETGDPMSAVTCSFYDEEAASAKALNKGTEVTIKGKCTGKLADVVLNKCSIQN
jgi:RecG-like helicase